MKRKEKVIEIKYWIADLADLDKEVKKGEKPAEAKKPEEEKPKEAPAPKIEEIPKAEEKKA